MSISRILFCYYHLRYRSRKSAHFSLRCLGVISIFCLSCNSYIFLASTRSWSRAATSSFSIMEDAARYLEGEWLSLGNYFSLLVAICRRVFEKLTQGLSGCRAVASIFLMDMPCCRYGETYLLPYFSFRISCPLLRGSLRVAYEGDDSLIIRESMFDYECQGMGYSSRDCTSFFMQSIVCSYYSSETAPFISLLLQLQSRKGQNRPIMKKEKQLLIMTDLITKLHFFLNLENQCLLMLQNIIDVRGGPSQVGVDDPQIPSRQGADPSKPSEAEQAEGIRQQQDPHPQELHSLQAHHGHQEKIAAQPHRSHLPLRQQHTTARRTDSRRCIPEICRIRQVSTSRLLRVPHLRTNTMITCIAAFTIKHRINQYFSLPRPDTSDSPGARMYLFYTRFPFSIVYSVTSLDPSCFVIVVFLVVTLLPLLHKQIEYTVCVVVVTDFEGPLMPPPKLLENEEEEKPPPPMPPLKKSLLNIEPKLPPKPPNPPNPPCLLPPLFLRLKNELKKSSSSWSKGLLVKNLAKMSSAWLKSKWLKLAALGPLKPYVSQILRFSASDKFSQASVISLNFSTASSRLLGFLSGCHLTANFLQAFLISVYVADLVRPSTQQQSRGITFYLQYYLNQCQKETLQNGWERISISPKQFNSLYEKSTDLCLYKLFDKMPNNVVSNIYHSGNA